MANPVEPTPTPAARQRAVNFEHTHSFVELLERLQVSLLVSTYQAGKLVVIGTHQGKLDFAFHSFEQVMGVAARPQRIAVGTKRQIWFLNAARDLAARVQPQGKYDACFLARTAQVTGEIHGHELAWGENELWVVNTLFSCLCTLHAEYSFVPRWRPPFISALAGEDRCHLNGLALENGQPRFVTAMAETDVPAGWRPTKATSGCLIDVPTGAILVRGFAMPHSPRLHEGKVYLLDSGRGQIVQVDSAAGTWEMVATLPGYTRGLALLGPYAFIGLSRIRETSVFGGIPIAEKRDQLKCGVVVVDLRNGQTVASLTFGSGVEEIFAVEILAGTCCAVLSGPAPADDAGETIWLVPNRQP